MPETQAMLAELRTIHREKARLQTPAYLWERLASDCNGDCANPRPVAVTLDGKFVIDCCAVYEAHEHLEALRASEAGLRRKLMARGWLS